MAIPGLDSNRKVSHTLQKQIRLADECLKGMTYTVGKLRLSSIHNHVGISGLLGRCKEIDGFLEVSGSF